MPSVVDEAIGRALSDASEDLRARDVRVVADLRAETDLGTFRDALYEAVYAVFRALPARLAPGTTLEVRTRDRAGGDVELVWESHETPGAPPTPRTGDLLRSGPYGDLYGLALIALERLCRTRAEHVQEPVDGPTGRTYRRRFMLLVPSLERAPGGYR